MASVAAPYGLIPVTMQGGAPNRGGAARMIPMSTNVATAFYAGAPVVLGTNGEVTVPASTPLAADTVPCLGVLIGIRYFDPTLGYELHSTYLPANAVTAGYTGIQLFVNDDPLQLYKVQADGPVTRAQLGLNFALENLQTGSAVTKKSNVAVTAASAGSAVDSVRLVDFVRSETSTPGDAFTDLIVRFAPGVHAYEKALGPA